MSDGAWLALAVLVALCLWTYIRVLRPLRRIRITLRALAAGSDAAAAGHESPRGTRAFSNELAAVAERMRELERHLGEERSSLEAILGSTADGVMIVDATGRIQRSNDALDRLFGIERAPVGKSVIEAFRDIELDQVVARTIETGESQSAELAIDTPLAGSFSRNHFRVTVFRPDAAGAIAIFHDLTQVKALETVRQEFVANVSHELRTPLSIINGYIETLLDGGLDDRAEAENFLRVMSRHGERLNLLIEDLLTISALESQSGALRIEKVDLRDCVRRVIERLESRIEEKNARIIEEFAPDFPEIDADGHRLDQVFSNLLDNALKYAHTANPVIRISAEIADAVVRITVADNGIGIPMKDHPHIFQRFYRVDKNRSREAGGTGLGLSIVKHVIQAHGGSVAVRSTPGHGTAFEMTFPLRATPADSGLRHNAG